MGYQVFWQVPNQVICMEIGGDLSLDDFAQINRTVIDMLDSSASADRVALLVDITRPGKVRQGYMQLKESQTYLMRSDLKIIMVAGNDKFMRLMMMLTFNLCRPSLKFFDNTEQALKFIDLSDAPAT